MVEKHLNNLQIYRFPPEEIELHPKDVAKLLYKDAPPLVYKKKMESKIFKETFRKFKTIYTSLLRPFGVTLDIPPSIIREIFKDTLTPISPIYWAVDWWEKASLLVATIGDTLEISVKNLQTKDNTFEALFLDTIGSVLVESVADKIQEIWASERMNNTYPIRYSPGYCQWDVKAQFDLFKYIGENNLEKPLSLTKGGMMYPRKSISAIMTMERKDPSSNLSAACRLCKNHCPYVR